LILGIGYLRGPQDEERGRNAWRGYSFVAACVWVQDGGA
jgi:hypothetical protein